MYDRQLKTTPSVIIKHPHDSEAIRASLQARKDHLNYDMHAQREVKPAPHPASLGSDHHWCRWSQGIIKSKPEIMWSKHHKDNTGETGYK